MNEIRPLVVNTQPIEKRDFHPLGFVQVHSIFETIQGEGPFCGTPCVFVRLAGCNLQCPACDTEYTSKRDLMAPVDVVMAVKQKRERGLVVITGGEPFRQALAPLISMFILNGYYVQVESNGTLDCQVDFWNKNPFERMGAYLVVSPKTPKLHSAVYENACAFKYVIEADNVEELDGLPITALRNPVPRHVARPPDGFTGPIYVQPLDDKLEDRNANNLAAAVHYSLVHGYILQLQVHKIIGVE